ncbi:Haloacid dehalogenase-like hydrolase-domain-containing protein [Coniochaeta sp. 2T2.1]|nr:Haloacid dehalogenase-like hydrolase-domain-containing protein [Coniochaeta sp. 2T2.1]
MSHPDLTTFKALSFDCYGTLIDWNAGLTADLQPILSQLPPSHPYNVNPYFAIQRFGDFSHELWHSQPKLLYPANLISSYKSLASELGVSLPPDEKEVNKIGSAPGRWSAFPDTVDALQRLGRRFKLILLSNVDNDNIRRTVEEHLGPAMVDGVYTAEEIGGYKPSLGNFEYLFERSKKEFGVEKEKGELLHVAVSLEIDHVPAKEVGLRSVYIARGLGGEGSDEGRLVREGKVGFEWRFETLGEFADEVERQFAAKGQ